LHFKVFMVDPRFYRSAGERRMSALLASIGLSELWDGSAEDLVVSGVSELETAAATDIVFVNSRDFAAALGETRAGVVIAAPDLVSVIPERMTRLASPHSQIVFSQVSSALFPNALQPWVTGIGPAPQLEEGVTIGANVSLGPGVEIGAGSVVGPNSVIGPGVSIGRNSVIGANCTVEFSYIGNDVVILPGARIGMSGFGYLPHRSDLVPVPQLGRAILQDRVEIGANTVVDRGALGDTVIGEGTKIGNLVVVAHNCRIGRNCMVVGFTGFAGSVVLEDNVTIAGGGGLAGHITLGTGTTVLAASWVAKSFPANSRIVGSPAMDAMEAWTLWATVQRMAKDYRK
jgi:UDP-3-O-[3-hydroxymyristoyl] glucosamine N-acyltransferase